MRTTIELPVESENALHALARQFKFTDEQAIQALVSVCLVHFAADLPNNAPVRSDYRAVRSFLIERFARQVTQPIRSTPDVLGGDARIRNTRIPVWLLVAHKKWGETDSEILKQYPSLNAADLSAAWDFYAANTQRVDAERLENEED